MNNDLKKEIFGDGAVQFINSAGDTDTTHSPENTIAHISRNSARYNGIMSISATGVDNGKGGGWEQVRGTHSGVNFH